LNINFFQEKISKNTPAADKEENEERIEAESVHELCCLLVSDYSGVYVLI